MDYPILQQRATPRPRAYKYPRERGDHLPGARDHHQASAPTTEPPTEAGRQTMDGQGNGDAGGSQCDIVARAFVDHYYRTFDFDRAARSISY